MELSEKYAYTVYEEKSFCAAAKALFVSQPALSLAVKRLEDSLEFKIFDRTTSPVSLTPEGKIYIEYLAESAEREREMKMRVKELEGLSYGTLSVGASCYTAYRIMSGIISTFARLHPKIRVRLDMGNASDVNILYNRAERGELDLIMKYEYDPLQFEATSILEERLAVAMPESLVIETLRPYIVEREELLNRCYDKNKEFSDPRIFEGIPFLRLGEHSATLGKMRELLGDYKTSPYIIENARHTAMHYNLMREGLGAVLLSDVHVMTSELLGNDIKYFVPASEKSRRSLYLLEKKNAPKNPIAKAFIEVATDFCKNLSQKEISEA